MALPTTPETQQIENIARRIRANPIEGTPDEMRRAFARLFPARPEGQDVCLGGVSCTAYGNGPLAIWLHGGGYVFGGLQSHGPAAARLAKLARCRVIIPAYRLAPEHVWPAMLTDVLGVVDDIAAPVDLIGDSAGGHLALNVARRRPERIRRMVLISPNTDRRGVSETRGPNSESDLMNTDEDDRALAGMAMPDLAGDGPDASPVTADLAALPGTYLTAASNEVLLDDTLLLARALACAHVAVRTDIVTGLWHLWPLWAGELMEADATLERISMFLSIPRGRGAR